MNKIIIIISFLFSTFISNAQVINYTPQTAAGYQFKYVKVDSGFAIPYLDTTIGRGVVRAGAIVCKPSDKKIYVYNGTKWVDVSTGGGSGPTNKVDSVTIIGNVLFYWINGTSVGVTLPVGYSQDFQQVTDNGNVTTNDISANHIYANASIATTQLFSSDHLIRTNTSNVYGDSLRGYITGDSIRTSNLRWNLPDTTGTFVLSINGAKPDRKGNVSTLTLTPPGTDSSTTVGFGLTKTTAGTNINLQVDTSAGKVATKYDVFLAKDEIYKEAIDLRAFGAVPDGITDCTPSLLTAKATVPFGAIIILKNRGSGIYKFNTSSTTFNGVKILAEDSVIISMSNESSEFIDVLTPTKVRKEALNGQIFLVQPRVVKENPISFNVQKSMVIRKAVNASDFSVRNGQWTSSNINPSSSGITIIDNKTISLDSSNYHFLGMRAATIPSIPGLNLTATVSNFNSTTLPIAFIRSTNSNYLIFHASTNSKVYCQRILNGNTTPVAIESLDDLNGYLSYSFDKSVITVKVSPDGKGVRLLLNGVERFKDEFRFDTAIAEIGFGYYNSPTGSASVRISNFYTETNATYLNTGKNTVQIFGDSQSSTFLTNEWAAYFKSALQGSYGNNVSIENYAVSGHTMQQQEAIFNTVTHKGISIIYCGTNNIQQQSSISGMITSLNNMVTTVGAKNAIVVIPPLYFSYALNGNQGQASGNYENGSAYRSAIARYCADNSITMVDLPSTVGVTTKETNIMRDDIHLSEYGAKLVGEQIANIYITHINSYKGGTQLVSTSSIVTDGDKKLLTEIKKGKIFLNNLNSDIIINPNNYKVGVNTETLDSTFNIGGGLKTTGGVRFSGLPTSAGTKTLRIDGSGNVSVVDTTVGGGGGTVTAIGVTTANGISGTSSGGATPNLTLTLGNITPISVTATNSVTAPYLYGGDKTTSYGGSTGAILGGTATHGILDFWDNNSRVGEFYTSSSAFNFFSDAGKDINFYVNNSFTNPAIGVLTNGNVGIGLTTPSYKLDVAGSGNFSGNLTAANLTSGTYTPSVTNVANITAATPYQCQYLRVGNTVTVSGQIDIDPILTATSTELRISLPITSNIAASQNLGGTGFCQSVTGLGLGISGDATNDAATFKFSSSDINNNTFNFTFTYTIL